MKTLRASHCTLEPLLASHAREMFSVLSDPAIYEFENDPPVSEEWLAHRYKLLETRTSAEGTEQWLNWVVRHPEGGLAGYVQATVLVSGVAYIAYELNSRYWRQGIGTSAVLAMLEELRSAYAVHTFVAVLKAANYRSMALLYRLGFSPAGGTREAEFRAAADERVMTRKADTPGGVVREWTDRRSGSP